MTDDTTPEVEKTGDDQGIDQDAENAESSTAQAETDSEDGSKGDPEPDSEESKPSGKVQKRIDQLTREKYEARRKAEELEKRLKELETKAKEPEKELVAPRYDDFDDDAAYQQALSEYSSDLALKKLKAEQQQSEQKNLEAERLKVFEERTKRFVDDVQTNAGHFDGIMDKLQDPVFSGIINEMNPDVVGLIQESDKNVALAYHLATNLDDADRISRMNPVKAAHELAKIEAGLEMPKPKKISSAPEPIEPIGSNQSAVSDPEKMSIDEWMKWRQKSASR